MAGQSRSRNRVATGFCAVCMRLIIGRLDKEEQYWCHRSRLSMSTIIIGTGIIGTATAFYLSESQTKGDTIHFVEASSDLFASASGYAGGFVARDWFSPPLAKLGALSFDLHKELAEKDDGYKQWGYTESTSTSLAETIGNHEGADWLREGVSRAIAADNTLFNSGHAPSWLKHKRELDIMSDGSTTAQMYVIRMFES